jgi:HK97 family phage major capsid protein
MQRSEEILGRLTAKRSELAAMFDNKGADGRPVLTDEQRTQIPALSKELDDLHDEWTKEVELERIEDANRKALDAERKAPRPMPFPGVGGDGAKATPFDAPGGNGIAPSPAAMKSLGRQFIESRAFKEYDTGTKKSPTAEFADFDVKTLFDTGTGWAPQAVRIPRLVDFALRRPVVGDLMPQGTTTQIAIVYMEETTFTNNAAAVAEGATKPEAALALTERTAPVRKIAVTLPVTDELMMDVPALEGYIDARLATMIQLKEEDYLLNGTGVAPQITGILNNANLQTQAKGADPTPTAVYKAIVKIQTTAFSEPSGYVTHPLDWQDIVTLQDTTGRYIWGDPSAVTIQRIWGLPVISTTAMTQNTGLVGDFAMGAMIFRRTGLTMEVTNSNEDDFKKNILRIRAEERLALAVWRGAAFCQVTGI